MRRQTVLLLVILLWSPVLMARQKLSGSRQGSAYTYIYRISPEEAALLYQSDMQGLKERFLHTKTDSFMTDGNRPPALKPGNYLFVKAAGNRLSGELQTIDDLQLKLLRNRRDLIIVLHNREGQLINDATVKAGRKNIAYDEVLHAYRLPNKKKPATITVHHQGIVHMASGRNMEAPRRKGNMIRRMTQRIGQWFGGNGHYRSRRFYYAPTEHEDKYKGFLVFNQPKYKPGDTVKLKAWVATRKGSPVNRPLLVRLSDQKHDVDTVLMTLSPYHAGGYEASFVLSDSLGLTLDLEYLVTLEEPGSRPYDLSTYTGKLDKDLYAFNRKALMRGRFKYEAYELGQVSFSARSDKSEHNRGNEVAIYCKATDENELPVMDGRVEVVVTTAMGVNGSFDAPQVFLPDTLWVYRQPLETVGETKIIVPDSIFPQASFPYEINCTFLNSNNERQYHGLYQRFINELRQIEITQRSDSLRISLLQAGKPIPAQATLYALKQERDTLSRQVIGLPAILPVSPFVAEYVVVADSLEKSFKNGSDFGVIHWQSSRTRDSVFIKVNNPRRLPFWYTIFAGQQVIRKGYGDSLSIAGKAQTPKDYVLSLQYIYGNRVKTEEQTVSFDEKVLNIQVRQPRQVYPGQQATIAIDVTDADGKPVSDADLTAYAFTRKFSGAATPAVPSWKAPYSGIKTKNSLILLQEGAHITSIALNWERWSREMQLDTVEYYKFLHPATIYSNTEPTPDGTTQIAPFVVSKGKVLPVQLLYIDEEPVFFNQADQLQQYSFRVTPGKHAVRIRINNKLISLDSIHAAAGRKTIFSINAAADNTTIRQTKMPATLSRQESILWSKYMILVENNFEDRLAVIHNGQSSIPLNFSMKSKLYAVPSYGVHGSSPSLQRIGATIQPGYHPVMLVGPLTPPRARLQVADAYSLPFEVEGNALYSFSQGVVKQKPLFRRKYAFSTGLDASTPPLSFKDMVLSASDIDSLWREYLDYRSANESLFTNKYIDRKGNGRLQIDGPRSASNSPLFVKNILLFREGDPGFIRVYHGIARDLGYVQPGTYKLVFLFRNNAYYTWNNIRIRQNGLNYYEAGKVTPLPGDTASRMTGAVIDNRSRSWSYGYQQEDLDLIATIFTPPSPDASPATRMIHGHVADGERRMPLSGVAIFLKGTRISTVTDQHGNFVLRVPEKGILLAFNAGYGSVAQELTDSSSMIKIDMLPATNKALGDVVVTGYGTRRAKRAYDEADQYAGFAGNTRVILRGANSLSHDMSPMIVMDGEVMGDFSAPNPSLLQSVTVLKESSATAIYGSRAANGLILITTKKQSSATFAGLEGEIPAPGNQLRTNFRDYAYWQPKLRTDQQGRASFTAAFPDDITSWRSFVIALGSKKRTGFAENTINAFKSLSGALAIPQFAIAGDSMQLIGKTLNYGRDSVSVKRSFSVNGNLVKEGVIGLRNSYIDSFPLTVAAQDSVRFKYTIQQPGGYFDGEERSIPVYKPGVLQTNGIFAVLDQDTTFTWQPDSSLGRLTVHAETAVLPVLLDEIESLRMYEYNCNEQVASRLKALLLKKKVYGYLHKDFREERSIRELVAKLNQHRWQGKFWGWWAGNDPIWWISLHATEALLQAEEQGFRISMDKQAMIDYLVAQFHRSRLGDRLSIVQLLQRLDAKADFKRYIDSLDSYAGKASLNQQLQILELKQQFHMPVAIDTLIAKQQPTMMGNVYWGEDSYRLLDNSIQNTLAMYRLLKNTGGQDALLKKIRHYFLEKRRDGRWRNTYESSLILETILPDLLASDAAAQPAAITIEGSNKATVNNFPYTATLQAGEKLTVKKEKGMPVYFTAYQQSWNPAPLRRAGAFEVTTAFEKEGQPVTILKAGEAVNLKATVTVTADADYVMVEIPVPAGCSYYSKAQTSLNNEVHREYFKQKVSLFCTSLPKGTYTFTVALLPRYSGSYTLNPAKAEMMYYPVFSGREGMKKVQIK